nr:universal stress protein [Methanosarcina sp. UBA5]
MIATDGSKCSQNAVLQGMELAKLMGAKVYALYVFNKDAYVPPVLEIYIITLETKRVTNTPSFLMGY